MTKKKSLKTPIVVSLLDKIELHKSDDDDVLFPIIGIGASAGGLSAFEAFFFGIPKNFNSGMAFVIIQHLAPAYKSLLVELLQKYTTMPVFEIEDGMKVNVNCVYVIPPNYDLSIFKGVLQLTEHSEPRIQHLPIDLFFSSLALDLKQLAFGVVLSGTGSDGSIGLRAIKEAGGGCMVQSEDSAEFKGMPLSAIATGIVDFEIPPGEMFAQISSYYKSHISGLPAPIFRVNFKNEIELNHIFALLRDQMGHDFSLYKPNTIYRRIERRMSVHCIKQLGDYVRYLKKSTTEVTALFNDLLIGVTGFFRDPEIFKELEEKIIPCLFMNRPVGSTIRIWSAGCSTGEEAYSLGILLLEYMEKHLINFGIQIFATDLDSRAIVTARAGIYPKTSVSVLSPDRISHFFTFDVGHNRYRINKNVRDMLIFSEHSIIKDPPFSKLDLIVCRNLLIYLGLELQKIIIPLFHYSLLPSGVLFLGSSEGIGDFGDLFAATDRKSKIYIRQEQYNGIFKTTILENRRQLPMPKSDSSESKKGKYQKIVSFREITEQAILKEVSLAGVLINRKGDAFYLHGRSGLFFEPATGEQGVVNIFKMAREGLQLSLENALLRADLKKEIVRERNILVKTNGHFSHVNLSVHPIKTDANLITKEQLFLVALEATSNNISSQLEKQGEKNREGGLALTTELSELEPNAVIESLRAELSIRSEYLQSTREELDSSNEELKSSNEEMQSVNEELQSTNEELETSKEELQSVNEELATVNTELHSKIFNLSQLNNDMNNLLAGTGVATIYVDINMNILRFTASATQIVNLISTDVGRPISHIVNNLIGHANLVEELQLVLDTLIPLEGQLQIKSGAWFSMVIIPYRTRENVIEGVVLTFTNITKMKNIEKELEKANKLSRLAVVVNDSYDAITVQDLNGKTIAWNKGAIRLYGWSEIEALELNVSDRTPKKLQDDALAKIIELSKKEVFEPYKTERTNKQGQVLSIWLTATALVDEQGVMYGVATTERLFNPSKN